MWSLVSTNVFVLTNLNLSPQWFVIPVNLCPGKGALLHFDQKLGQMALLPLLWSSLINPQTLNLSSIVKSSPGFIGCSYIFRDQAFQAEWSPPQHESSYMLVIWFLVL